MQTESNNAFDDEVFRKLYHVSKEIILTLEPEHALQKIIDAAVELTSAGCGSVALLNPTSGKLEILASNGLTEVEQSVRLDVGKGITGYVAATGESILVTDVRDDNRYIAIRDNVRSELACPLESDGHLTGVINVDSDRIGAFTENDLIVLKEISYVAAKVVNNAWRHEQVLHRVDLFAALTRISKTVNNSLTLEGTLNVVTSEASNLIDGKLASIMLLNSSDPRVLEIKSTYGGGEYYRDSARVINIEDSLMGIVIRRKKPIQIPNIYESSRFQNQNMAKNEGLVSILSVPVQTNEKILGVLNIYKGEVHNFSNEEVECVSALAELAAIAIDRASLYRDIAAKESLINQNDKLSALGLLAAEVAHEIRNPLTVIKMLFHSMELDFGDNDPRVEDARIIREKMDQLNQIVERVLRFARNSEPVISQVNLNAELEDLGALLRMKLDQKNITINKDFSESIPLINGDALQLNQAILNIVINAIEAMDDGGILTLKTSTEFHDQPDKARLILEISDTGKGIPQDIQEKILSPILHSTKSSGTGIGLALVKKIIDTHKAEMVVDSSPGFGATIRIYFLQDPQFD